MRGIFLVTLSFEDLHENSKLTDRIKSTEWLKADSDVRIVKDDQWLVYSPQIFTEGALRLNLFIDNTIIETEPSNSIVV